MSSLKVIVCSNHEALCCDRGQVACYTEAIYRLERDGIEIEFNSNFRHWNGGPGYAFGVSYVRLAGYGPIKDMDDCRKAMCFLLSGGGSDRGTRVTPPDDWPSSSEVEAAFDLLGEVQDIEIPEPSDKELAE